MVFHRVGTLLDSGPSWGGSRIASAKRERERKREFGRGEDEEEERVRETKEARLRLVRRAMVRGLCLPSFPTSSFLYSTLAGVLLGLDPFQLFRGNDEDNGTGFP